MGWRDAPLPAPRRPLLLRPERHQGLRRGARRADLLAALGPLRTRSETGVRYVRLRLRLPTPRGERRRSRVRRIGHREEGQQVDRREHPRLLDADEGAAEREVPEDRDYVQEEQGGSRNRKGEMSVAPPVLRVLSLCSGVGMLDRGISIAHPGARVVGFCERDAYAAAVLVARMEDESLEQAPVWCGNLEDADWTAWRGAVDCVSAGFPCPPVSVAGQRKGTDDARWILPAIMRCVREVVAEWVFLENVGGLLSANAGREFGEVLRLLAESGFDAEWLVLPASDVGAPHERERVFFLAHALRLPSGERPGRERVLDDGSQVAESRRGAERQEQQERIGWGGGSAIARETGSSLVNPPDDHGRRGGRGGGEGTRARGLGRRGPA